MRGEDENTAPWFTPHPRPLSPEYRGEGGKAVVLTAARRSSRLNESSSVPGDNVHDKEHIPTAGSGRDGGLPGAVRGDRREAKGGRPAGLDQEAELASANAELIDIAFKLKQHGWGESSKQGWKNVSIESLITAARLLKEVPRPGKPEEVKVVVGKEKDAPETTDTKLSEAENFDAVGEANDILKRARLLVKETVTDAKKAAAYETLIADGEKFEGTKAVVGGPKLVKQTLSPGQSHTYTWHWQDHQPGHVTFQASHGMRLQIVHDEDGAIYFDSVVASANPHFHVGGYGKPGGRQQRLTVRVINTSPMKGHYVLGAH